MARLPSDTENRNKNHTSKLEYIGYGLGALAVGAGAFIVSRFHTARAGTILARSGFLVKDVSNVEIGSSFVQFPFQYVKEIDIGARSHHIVLNAMSVEKLNFNCPFNITLIPETDPEELKKYVVRVHNTDNIDVIVKAIIEGEARTVASNSKMEDIFTGRDIFKNNIFNALTDPLKKIGLKILNGNIQDLRDAEGSDYFKNLSKKIAAQTENKAKVDIAEQKKIGTLGENERTKEIVESNTNLARIQAEQKLISETAKIENEAKASILSEQTKAQIEVQKAKSQMEANRAKDLTKSIVDAEIQVKKTEGESNSVKIASDAQLYKAKQEADAIRLKMEAEAQGELAKLQAKAQGERAILEAQAGGLSKINEAIVAGGESLQRYLMIEKNVITKVAEEQAKALYGMNPNVTIWTPSGKESMDTFRSFVPFIDTILKQTGYTVPDWLIKKESEVKPLIKPVDHR